MSLLSDFESRVAIGCHDFRIDIILDYVRHNPKENLTLPHLSKVVGISPYQVCRLFKEHIGIPPARCAKFVRFQLAESLLLSTTLSVKEVMARVGLSDESHFVRDFKEIIGESPVQHRLRARQRSVVLPSKTDTSVR
jgi:transcriptional regulator GlxA family with amidase domain